LQPKRARGNDVTAVFFFGSKAVFFIFSIETVIESHLRIR
jgi:hypothetical protein